MINIHFLISVVLVAVCLFVFLDLTFAATIITAILLLSMAVYFLSSDESKDKPHG